MSNIIEVKDVTNATSAPVTGLLSGTTMAAHVVDLAVHPGENATDDRTWGGAKASSKTSCAADTQIKASAGYYYGYMVTVVTATAAISIYDNTAESGTVVDVIPTGTAAGARGLLPVPIPMSTGIYCGFGASATGTVVILYS